MRTIGLIGGMSWESTALYYQWINQMIKERLGGLHSAKLILHSVDFAEIETMQAEGRWDDAADTLVAAAKGLHQAGAEAIVICTNTMHKVAENIEQEVFIPLIHIADATGAKLQQNQILKVALLGTKFTMEQDFYKGRLQKNFGLDVITPNTEQRELIHDVIYNELCLGEVNTNSQHQYHKIIDDLAKQGAQGVILGCTEITLLVDPGKSSIETFDTTRIHAQAAVDFCLNKL